MTNIKGNRATAFLALALTVAFALVYYSFDSRHLSAGDGASESSAQSGSNPAADTDSHHSKVALVGRADAEASGPIPTTSSPRGARVTGRMLIENAEFACKR